MAPVVTRCGHYFCEKCATEEYKTTSKCSQCGAETHGILNTANRIIDKLEKRQREAAEAQGDEKQRQTDIQEQAEATPSGTDSGNTSEGEEEEADTQKGGSGE